MKIPIILAVWLATGTYAWADEVGSGAPAGKQAPMGWNTSASQPGAVQQAGANSDTAPAKPQADTPPSGNDPLPPPQSVNYSTAQESLIPLTPEEVRRLRSNLNDLTKAENSPQMSVVPKISALTVDLGPGASLPLVRTAVDYPSSITFIDSTGAPWKLGAAPISGNPAFIAYWVPDTPVMVIYAKAPFKRGNVTVYLEGLSVPIVVNVNSGEPDTAVNTWAVDSRLDLRIPRRGPSALATAAPEHRIGLHDSTLQTFLDGVPPKDARRLKTTGEVPDTTVWQLGDDLYIRSRADIRDEFVATLSSADGTHLWKLPLTPYVSFSVMGRTTALNVALE
ncbi:DotH/IcmK family type IV secretion protein [Pseudomonas syringae pv. syringae]|uniref:DotH/IcmK family type IV secretion protein n=1 Tax=Pseudomonas syringae TaxID=317 RepID=UPI00200B6F07|nr:DotH/IcmK family type IV secretion protein [Pseudomonas syringae]MCK9759925.1 DotH/IcmK family type IV secretion protein [Pseudomonas syringae pv. syringae]MCK9774916.1 DotH/IcmK family type IV secretion protein [Pseudomonas syringae pv. syringae]